MICRILCISDSDCDFYQNLTSGNGQSAPYSSSQGGVTWADALMEPGASGMQYGSLIITDVKHIQISIRMEQDAGKSAHYDIHMPFKNCLDRGAVYDKYCYRLFTQTNNELHIRSETKIEGQYFSSFYLIQPPSTPEDTVDHVFTFSSSGVGHICQYNGVALLKKETFENLNANDDIQIFLNMAEHGSHYTDSAVREICINFYKS